MTLFDLLFIVAFLAAAGSIARVAYLLLRKRSIQAARLSRRIGISIVAYLLILVSVSAVQPKQQIAEGAQNCFDDWCIVVDRATRQPSIGSSARGDFVIVSTSVVSRARGRPQREKDVYGELVDNDGRSYSESARGEAALLQASDKGATLTDFVAPGASNQVQLVFEVPPGARSLEFVTRHSWFPGALIIGGAESLFHRPAVVPLREISGTAP